MPAAGPSLPVAGSNEGGGATGATVSIARGARSTGASALSVGPSRYGLSSPCSTVGRALGRGPRPRRGGRRRSFMQCCRSRWMLVSTRQWRAHVLLMRTFQTRRRGWNGLAGMPHGGMPSGYADDVGLSATRLVLCLDRLPARIPHAGSDKGPTRARRFVSPRIPVGDGTPVLPRVDARSVDAERCRPDGRNEYRQQSRFAQPTVEGCELRAPGTDHSAREL